jgi:fatty acid CoA ligase FadD9
VSRASLKHPSPAALPRLVTLLLERWAADPGFRRRAASEPEAAARELGLQPEPALRTAFTLLLEERSVSPPPPAIGLRRELHDLFEAYADRRCLGRIADDTVEWWTYREVWSRAHRLGSALRRRLGEGAVVALLGATSREWLVADLACVLHGLCTVPWSPHSRAADVESALRRCGAVAAIGDRLAAPALREAEGLRLLVTWGDGGDGVDGPAVVGGGHLRAGTAPAIGVAEERSIDELVTEEREPLPLPLRDDPGRVVSIVHSSGSTGAPKFVVLSARRVEEHLASVPAALAYRVALAWSPLHLLAERKNVWATLRNGGRVAAWRGRPEGLLEDFARVRPTWAFAAPALWARLHAEHSRGLAVARAGAVAPEDFDAWRSFLAVIFRCLLGGRVRLLVSGGALVAPEVLGFLRECFTEAIVVDGYGATEAGTIALDGVPAAEVELVDCPELGYRASDRPYPRGEVRVRCHPDVTGYVGETRPSAIRNGWFYTGDLGRWVDGRLEILGRRGRAVKLASGEFLTPDRIETVLGLDPWIDEVFVHAEPGWEAPAAVIVPSAVARQAVARLAPGPRLARWVARLRQAGARAGLRGFEVPATVLLRRRPFSALAGAVTESGELHRMELTRRYRARLTRARREAAALPGPLSPERLAAALADPPALHAPLDSLALMELRLAIERLEGRTLALAPGCSVAQAAAQVAAAKRADDAHVPPEDLVLAPEITPRRHRRTSRGPGVGARVVVTGATGFIGSHLLAGLLSEGEAPVLCLVRAGDSDDGRERLAAAFDRYGLDAPALDSERLLVESADLGAEWLGLGRRRFDSLADAAAEIIHAGALVAPGGAYREHHANNVAGTASILKLAARGGATPVTFVSTIGVLSAGREFAPDSGVCSPAPAPPSEMDGYAASKWVGEALCWQAAARGIPVTVFRPGLVTAHSISGIGRGNDLSTVLLRALVVTGAFPSDIAPRLDVVPVDYVAGAILRLRGRGRLFHLTGVPPRLEFGELIRQLESCGLRLRPVAFEEWKERVRAEAAQGRLSGPAVQALTGSSFPSPTAVPCPETIAALEAVDPGLLRRARIGPSTLAATLAALRWPKVAGSSPAG